MIVAIDGPVGVGKSTVARAVARQLGLLHIDTGAMYRALAWRCLEEDLAADDPGQMADLARRTQISLVPSPAGPKVFCNDHDVTDIIRSPEVTALVSQVSAHAGLREIVVDAQRQMGASGSVVMEGRDIGTVVFPNADVKLYLEAKLEARVRRRAKDFEAKGTPWSYDEIRQSILARDEYDKNREVSPLRVAQDAIVLDTTDLDFDAVVVEVVNLIRHHLSEKKTLKAD
jgi:cytidylate kinase